MNILHVPCAYAPVRGGAELVCKRVSEELAARGHRVRVLTSDVASVESYYRPAPSRIRPGHETRNGVEVRRLRFGGRLDAVLALTEHEASRLRAHYAVPAERLFVCGVGVDLPPACEQRPRRRQVVYLGRKVPEKNIAELLAAMRLVWESRPDTELVLA